MDSDIEVIDNSISSDAEHRTVFVAGSEDDSDDENYLSNNTTHCKSLRLSLSAEDCTVQSDQAEDVSKLDSTGQLEDSINNSAISSSEEEAEEMSPEILPRRPPPKKDKDEDSFIGRKTKKRIMLIDSDTDNSIIIEHDKNKKMTCLKDTPVKFTTDKDLYQNVLKKLNISANVSQEDEMCDTDKDNTGSELEDEDETLEADADQAVKNKTSSKKDDKEHRNSNKVHTDTEGEEKQGVTNQFSSNKEDKKISTSEPDDNHADSGTNCDDDDDDDEDVMVFSKATRMSIMGVVPRDDNESDDSDFIASDESDHKSTGSTNSLNDLPEVSLSSTLPLSPLKSPEPTKDGDTSRMSCSPFSSPLIDLTNIGTLNTTGSSKKSKKQDIVADCGDELIIIEDNHDTSINKSSNASMTVRKRMKYSNTENEIVYDEDVTIIDSKPEVIALSSDDEEEGKKRSPRPKKGNLNSTQESQTKRSQDMKQYLLPESYPNQVVYVKKSVRENELRKLEGLKADLQGVKMLLEKMDPSYLPDTGLKLGERLASLEAQVRVQGTKVANMLVEPEAPTMQQMSSDGFGGGRGGRGERGAGGGGSQDAGLSWDDIQAGSNAVQPRWQGTQGMATHMAERNLILERLRLLHSSLASRPPDSAHASPPRALRATLLPHQAHALAWLQWRETQRPRAGILADDMGLGKTITMIALIATDKERASEGDSDDDDDVAGAKLTKGGTLVVCPASLIQQWANEVTKHCKPHQLTVCLHHGANRAKQANRLAHHDIVVTTYNILQRDGDSSGVLGRMLWRRIILDEAHIVRNYKSATSLAVCGLKGSRRWCLTGTPVQNKDLDLFALVKFMRCSPFDDLVMWKKWIDNKSHGGQERMSTIMRCILLRRSKLQLQERGELTCLPTRTPHLKEVTLTKQEMNVYQKVLVFSKTLFAQFLQQRAEKQSAGGFPGAAGNSAYDKMHKKMIALQGAKPVKSHEILVLLLRLRQVCCHCGLIAAMLDAHDDVELQDDVGSKDLLDELHKLSLDDSVRQISSKDDDETGVPSEGTSVAEAIRSVLSPNNPVFSLKKRSSKIEAVMECLESNVFKNKGEKAIVVSQWTSVLRLVEDELAQRRTQCVTLSGAVPVGQRHALVNKINDPASGVTVMLLSLCAGGVGLNLCGANHLLLLDPHWNPQLEQQAQDRVYRVGQARPVHIYRFMCVDTVEQSIRTLQEAKLKLAEAVLTGAKNSASKLTIEDLKMLFNMGPTSQDKDEN